jgi:hypothetical protein
VETEVLALSGQQDLGTPLAGKGVALVFQEPSARTMLRFRRMRSLQKFASVHACVHSHFNVERHLADRQTCKQRRTAVLAEWWAFAT